MKVLPSSRLCEEEMETPVSDTIPKNGFYQSNGFRESSSPTSTDDELKLVYNSDSDEINRKCDTTIKRTPVFTKKDGAAELQQVSKSEQVDVQQHHPEDNKASAALASQQQEQVKSDTTDVQSLVTPQEKVENGIVSAAENTESELFPSEDQNQTDNSLFSKKQSERIHDKVIISDKVVESVVATSEKNAKVIEERNSDKVEQHNQDEFVDASEKVVDISKVCENEEECLEASENEALDLASDMDIDDEKENELLDDPIDDVGMEDKNLVTNETGIVTNCEHNEENVGDLAKVDSCSNADNDINSNETEVVDCIKPENSVEVNIVGCKELLLETSRVDEKPGLSDKSSKDLIEQVNETEVIPGKSGDSEIILKDELKDISKLEVNTIECVTEKEQQGVSDSQPIPVDRDDSEMMIDGDQNMNTEILTESETSKEHQAVSKINTIPEDIDSTEIMTVEEDQNVNTDVLADPESQKLPQEVSETHTVSEKQNDFKNMGIEDEQKVNSEVLPESETQKLHQELSVTHTVSEKQNESENMVIEDEQKVNSEVLPESETQKLHQELSETHTVSEKQNDSENMVIEDEQKVNSEALPESETQKLHQEVSETHTVSEKQNDSENMVIADEQKVISEVFPESETQKLHEELSETHFMSEKQIAIENMEIEDEQRVNSEVLAESGTQELSKINTIPEKQIDSGNIVIEEKQNVNCKVLPESEQELSKINTIPEKQKDLENVVIEDDQKVNSEVLPESETQKVQQEVSETHPVPDDTDNVEVKVIEDKLQVNTVDSSRPTNLQQQQGAPDTEMSHIVVAEENQIVNTENCSSSGVVTTECDSPQQGVDIDTEMTSVEKEDVKIITENSKKDNQVFESDVNTPVSKSVIENSELSNNSKTLEISGQISDCKQQNSENMLNSNNKSDNSTISVENAQSEQSMCTNESKGKTGSDKKNDFPNSGSSKEKRKRSSSEEDKSRSPSEENRKRKKCVTKCEDSSGNFSNNDETFSPAPSSPCNVVDSFLDDSIEIASEDDNNSTVSNIIKKLEDDDTSNTFPPPNQLSVNQDKQNNEASEGVDCKNNDESQSDNCELIEDEKNIVDDLTKVDENVTDVKETGLQEQLLEDNTNAAKDDTTKAAEKRCLIERDSDSEDNSSKKLKLDSVICAPEEHTFVPESPKEACVPQPQAHDVPESSSATDHKSTNKTESKEFDKDFKIELTQHETTELMNLKSMSRKDLEQMVLRRTVETLAVRSKLAVRNQEYLAMQQKVSDYKKKLQPLNKQVHDLSNVILRLDQALKKNPKPVRPLKVTRSVGLQVAVGHGGIMSKSTGGRGIKTMRPGNRPPGVIPSPRITPGKMKVALPGQGLPAIALPRSPVHSHPVSSPGMRTYPAVSRASNTTTTPTKPAIQEQQTYMMHQAKAQSSPLIDRLNSQPHNLQVRRYAVMPSPGKPSRLDMTDSNHSSAAVGTQQISLVQQPSGMLSIIPPQQGGSAPVAYLVQGPQSRQVLLTPTGHPGGRTLNPMSLNTVQWVQGIPKTDSQTTNMVQNQISSGIPGQVTVRPTAAGVPLQRGSLYTVGPSVASIQRPPSILPSRALHPAPLPAAPNHPATKPGWKLVPPKPVLKISRVQNGIVLSWNMSITSSHEDMKSYQIYAYQESKDPPSSLLWKTVGDVKALALPMACTLTQFKEGHKYHFSVRAVDIHSRMGPHSDPTSIILVRH